LAVPRHAPDLPVFLLGALLIALICPGGGLDPLD